jgi:thiamine-phosphate pyrophosphorylase
VLQEVSLPAVAIGGITADNIDQLVAAGAKAVAVSSAVIAAEDPAAAARAIREKLPAGEQA